MKRIPMTMPKPPPQRMKIIQCSHAELWNYLEDSFIKANNEVFGTYEDEDTQYLIIYHNGIFLRAEPVYHSRVKGMYDQAYLLGYWDGHAECLSKPHGSIEPMPPPDQVILNPDTPADAIYSADFGNGQPERVRAENANSVARELIVEHYLEEIDDKLCAVCGGAIFKSPSGDVCANGHGGAETIGIEERIK